MRTNLISRGTLAGVALLATVSMAACTAHPAASPGGPPATKTTSPAASAPASPAATAAATPTVAAPSPTPTGVENLFITAADKGELTARFTSWFALSPSDLVGGGPLPGSAYYAYDPATKTYWALATFAPVNPDAPSYAFGSMARIFSAYYGDGTQFFKRIGSDSLWDDEPGSCASNLGCGAPVICGELSWFPANVLTAW